MAIGKKTGGRRKGSRNKASAAKERAIAKSGLTPLEFMLKVMRDEKVLVVVRLDAAKAAASYVHPKLSSVTHGGAVGTYAAENLRELSDAELTSFAAILARITPKSSAPDGSPSGD
jgi:hypothetical protein